MNLTHFHPPCSQFWSRGWDMMGADDLMYILSLSAILFCFGGEWDTSRYNEDRRIWYCLYMWKVKIYSLAWRWKTCISSMTDWRDAHLWNIPPPLTPIQWLPSGYINQAYSFCIAQDRVNSECACNCKTFFTGTLQMYSSEVDKLVLLFQG